MDARGVMHCTHLQRSYNNVISGSNPPDRTLLLPTANNIPTDPKRFQRFWQIQTLNPLLLASSELDPILEQGN